jgi:hypothetical protein
VPQVGGSGDATRHKKRRASLVTGHEQAIDEFGKRVVGLVAPTKSREENRHSALADLGVGRPKPRSSAWLASQLSQRDEITKDG